jgi:hypothetical protein
MTPTWQLLETLIEFITNDEFLTQLPLSRAFFAGGAVRDISNGRWPKDYDIFFGSEADVARAVTVLDSLLTNTSWSLVKSKFGNYNLTIASLPGFQGPIVVQFITMISGTPVYVTSRFDFTCNIAWYNFVDSTKYVSAAALKGSPLTMCTSIHRPVQALFRIQKFVSMGYTIPGDTLVALVNKITTQGIPTERIVSELGFCVSGEEEAIRPQPTTQTTPETVRTTFSPDEASGAPLLFRPPEQILTRRFTPEEVEQVRTTLESRMLRISPVQIGHPNNLPLSEAQEELARALYPELVHTYIDQPIITNTYNPSALTTQNIS